MTRPIRTLPQVARTEGADPVQLSWGWATPGTWGSDLSVPSYMGGVLVSVPDSTC